MVLCCKFFQTPPLRSAKEKRRWVVLNVRPIDILIDSGRK